LEKNQSYDPAKLNLSPAHRAAKELESVSTKTLAALKPAVASGELTASQIASINRLLMKGEANFILPDGIPGRPWFKHILYSSRYTYAHLELPAITEAVESGNWTQAQHQAEILVKALSAETELMKQVASVAESLPVVH